MRGGAEGLAMGELRRTISTRLPSFRIPASALLVLGFAVVVAGPSVRGGSEAAGIAPAPAAAYSFGDENSWIRVQNVGTGDANVTIAYFDADGRLLAGDGCPTPACPRLGPGQGATFFQALNPALPSGYRGSATVYSNQPLAVLEAKDVGRSGAMLIDGSTMNMTSGAGRLYLPLIMRADGPYRTWNSRFTVQNLTSTLACVTITYLSGTSDSEVAWDPYRPGDNVTRRWGCPNGGHPIVPFGTATRDADGFPVGAPFTGSVRIETHTNWLGVPGGYQVLAANAETWNGAFNLLTSYRAITDAEMAGTVLLPLLERDTGPQGSFSTQFQIENRNAGTPTLVRLRFEGVDADDGSYVVKENWIGVNASRSCVQASDFADNCLAPGDKLPRNFVGTGRLVASSAVGVVVNRGSYLYSYSSHLAPGGGDAATRVALPFLNKGSWLRIFVADGAKASVRIRYIGNLPGGEQSRTVTVNREHTAFQALESLLPATFAGTAILESDRPIVAVASLTADAARGDREIVYNGVPLR